MEKKSTKVGALWKREKNGKPYLSGQIELNGKKINIFVFKNDHKEQEKHPDFVINSFDVEPTSTPKDATTGRIEPTNGTSDGFGAW